MRIERWELDLITRNRLAVDLKSCWWALSPAFGLKVSIRERVVEGVLQGRFQLGKAPLEFLNSEVRHFPAHLGMGGEHPIHVFRGGKLRQTHEPSYAPL